MLSKRNPKSPRVDRSTVRTTHTYRGYVFTIGFTDEDGPWYVVDYPDIPGIITSGPTLARAFANACEALDCHLEALEKCGLPVPKAKHKLVVTPSSNNLRRKAKLASKR